MTGTSVGDCSLYNQVRQEFQSTLDFTEADLMEFLCKIGSLLQNLYVSACLEGRIGWLRASPIKVIVKLEERKE